MAKNSNPEWGLSHWVDTLLDRVMLGESWHTAVETGVWMVNQSREAAMNAANKRKARGIKPHHLDWYAWQLSTGIYVQFELKVEGRPTTPGQDDTMIALRRNKIPTGVFETVPDVCEFLINAGFALHGNARRIAVELHQQYMAKRREVLTTKKSAPHRSKPRETASAGMVNRARAKGIFL